MGVFSLEGRRVVSLASLVDTTPWRIALKQAVK
jgi:hypothetical protein